MSLMALIAAGQHGRLIQGVAGVLGIEERVAGNALERLLRPLAHRLSDRAADPAEQEIVLDVIASGDFQRFLDDPRLLFGRDAVRDGEETLAYLYGSVEIARAHARTIGPPAGLDGEVFVRLMTLAASLMLAAMARQLAQRAQSGSRQAGLADLLRDLGHTILRGLADGTVRTLFRRAGFSRRMTWRRLNLRRRHRPAHRPSIDELLGDLLDKEAPG